MRALRRAQRAVRLVGRERLIGIAAPRGNGRPRRGVDDRARGVGGAVATVGAGGEKCDALRRVARLMQHRRAAASASSWQRPPPGRASASAESERHGGLATPDNAALSPSRRRARRAGRRARSLRRQWRAERPSIVRRRPRAGSPGAAPRAAAAAPATASAVVADHARRHMSERRVGVQLGVSSMVPRVDRR